MNDNMLVRIDGQNVPVKCVKHWSFSPESFVPNRSEREMHQWGLFQKIKDAWVRLDPSIFMKVLSPNFSYGSYWVNQNLDCKGYQHYIREKFNTIRVSNSKPELQEVVLYEGLAPQDFCYALRMRQNNIETLLTCKFDDYGIVSMYITDPQIFTFEPTFSKGGVVDEKGEPRLFTHVCSPDLIGKVMSASQLQEFAVECITLLFKESGAEIVGGHKSCCKEFPNIVTKCGPDTFYHRIDVSSASEDYVIYREDVKEYLAIAAEKNAWPMVMPVSLFCAETGGRDCLCGGSFFIKALEARKLQ